MKTWTFLIANCYLLFACINNPEPPPVITISDHPVSINVTVENISESLSVSANVTQKAVLSYQWYENTADSNTGGTAINGETSEIFTIPENLELGEYYFFCELTAKRAVSVRSAVAVVNVLPVPYYGISLSHTGTYTFPPATFGYAQQNPLTITIYNTGNQATGTLAITLSGENQSSFTRLTTSSINSIAIGGSRTFNVRPNTGLGFGTYTATVTVSGGNGITASFDLSFSVNTGDPSVPQNFTAIPGNGEVILFWAAPSSDGGIEIIRYEVSENDTSTWVTASSNNSHTFSSLTNGTSYTFLVRAVNAIGSSTEASVSAVPGASPSAPQNLTAEPGNERALLSWEAPADDGGREVFGYQVSANNGLTWSAVSGDTSYSFTDLTNGQTYTFHVRALNAAGNGEASSPVSATPMTSPSAPLNFTAEPGNAQAVISWTAPSSDGGSAIIRYEVSSDSGLSWEAADGNTGHTFNGLINGQIYTFNVRAVNAAGNGEEASAAASPTILSAPQNFTATPGDGQAVLSWTAPASDGGIAIIRYEVSSDNGETWFTASSNTGHTFTGLANGTSYTFRVRAVNIIGNGAEAFLTFTLQQPVPENEFEYFWVDEHDNLVTTSGGAVTIAVGETLSFSAQGTGYTVWQWHLNGKNTGQSGNTYLLSSIVTGPHTIGLFVYKDGKLYNTNVVVEVR